MNKQLVECTCGRSFVLSTDRDELRQFLCPGCSASIYHKTEGWVARVYRNHKPIITQLKAEDIRPNAS